MAAPVHVQAVSAQSTSSVTSITSPSFNSTSGNLLVASGVGTAAETGTPYTDSKSNTWTAAVAQTQAASSAFRISQRFAKNITGGASHTVTYATGANETLAVAVEEMSGADTSNPLDQHSANAPVAGTNPHNGTSITPSQTNTLAVATISQDGGGSETYAATGTGTVRTSQTNTSFQVIALSTDTRSSAAAVTEGFNLTADDSVSAVVLTSNYIGAAAAATAIPRERVVLYAVKRASYNPR